jgi:hypothetical protein
MLTVTKRKITHRQGTEGPRHDPYSYEELTVQVNNTTTTIRFGSLGYVWVTWNGQRCPEGDTAQMLHLFQHFAGMSYDQAIRAYNRAQPYVEDPMGSLSDYE